MVHGKFKESVTGAAILIQINCAAILDFCTTCLHLHTSCVQDLSTSEAEAYLTNRAHTVVSNSHMCRVSYLASTQDVGTI